jgi:hypothetical protein
MSIARYLSFISLVFSTTEQFIVSLVINYKYINEVSLKKFLHMQAIQLNLKNSLHMQAIQLSSQAITYT